LLLRYFLFLESLFEICATTSSMRALLPVGVLVTVGACGLELTGAGGTQLASPTDAAVDSTLQLPDDARAASAGDGSRDGGGVARTDADAPMPIAFLATDPGAPSCSQGGQSPPGPLAIARRSRLAVMIDGQANEWPARSVWSVIRVPYGSREPEPPSVCAEFTASWDSDALYFYIRVADMNHPQPMVANVFDNDAIELFVGAKEPADDTGVYRVNDLQLIVDVHSAGYLNRGTADPSRDTVINRSYPSTTAEFQFAAKLFAWGYAVEVRVDPAVLGEPTRSLTANSVYPFTMGVDDGLRIPETRKHYYLWRFDKTIQTACLPNGAQPKGFCCASNDVGAYCNTRFFDRAKLLP
jgi:hypothetical protein